jgi:hypothetical protein
MVIDGSLPLNIDLIFKRFKVKKSEHASCLKAIETFLVEESNGFNHYFLLESQQHAAKFTEDRARGGRKKAENEKIRRAAQSANTLEATEQKNDIDYVEIFRQADVLERPTGNEEKEIRIGARHCADHHLNLEQMDKLISRCRQAREEGSTLYGNFIRPLAIEQKNKEKMAKYSCTNEPFRTNLKSNNSAPASPSPMIKIATEEEKILAEARNVRTKQILCQSEQFVSELTAEVVEDFRNKKETALADIVQKFGITSPFVSQFVADWHLKKYPDFILENL